MDRVSEFEKLGFGMFVHFGLYSILGQGEWAYTLTDISHDKYCRLPEKFKVSKSYAKNLVAIAKKAGCKYITITTRHHDGFSLYDTKGLNDYDAVHSACGRDLIKEFVDECNKASIVPFFYHTLLDWYNNDYNNNFPAYIDYLVKSIEILCTNYGKIGGIWFDGMWDKKDVDWQEERIYATIRKYQPDAIIINNTGLLELGKVSSSEIDSVTFERGKPFKVDETDRHRAGEMCQVLNDHWGYAKDDMNYKPLSTIIGDLLNCRRYGCNFLLNVGPDGKGNVIDIDKGFLKKIGEFIKLNKNFIYEAKPCDLEADNAFVLKDDKHYYLVIENVNMYIGSSNVVPKGFDTRIIKVHSSKMIKNVIWLDNGKKVKMISKNEFEVNPFSYESSLTARIVRFDI